MSVKTQMQDLKYFQDSGRKAPREQGGLEQMKAVCDGCQVTPWCLGPHGSEKLLQTSCAAYTKLDPGACSQVCLMPEVNVDEDLATHVEALAAGTEKDGLLIKEQTIRGTSRNHSVANRRMGCRCTKSGPEPGTEVHACNPGTWETEADKHLNFKSNISQNSESQP